MMEKDLLKALKVLRSGGIILYPTDTVWGIGCDATCSSAVDRIYKLKKRDDHKSMIILVANEQAILEYTSDTDSVLFEKFNQRGRPTTFIYEKAVGLPDNLVNENGSIAIRLVQEPFCKSLITRLKKPLVSTSANISGQPTPAHFEDISDEIKKGVDYSVSYRSKDKTPATPSRIIKLTTTGETVVIRD